MILVRYTGYMMLTDNDFRVVAAAYKAGIITIETFLAVTNEELEMDLTIMARAVHRATGERVYPDYPGSVHVEWPEAKEEGISMRERVAIANEEYWMNRPEPKE